MIVVIKAGYAGHIKSGGGVINKYGSQERSLTFILFISDDVVVAEKVMEMVNFVTDDMPTLTNNAKVAVHTDSKAFLVCVKRNDRPVIYSEPKIWNSNCIIQLADFK